ncbi:hypothetical protein V1509DRAFT_306632 [Lipomyces kononenkoae]
MTVLHLVLLSVVACASAYTPVASQSWDIPPIVNSWVPTEPGYYMTPVMKPFTLSGVTNWGRMNDSMQEYNVYRDGGGSCSLYNRTFWVYSDSSAYSKTTGLFLGAASNSMTLAMDFNQPNKLKDFTLLPSTGWSPAIPFTEAEASVSRGGDTGTRYALWTNANCAQLTETRAMHFFKVQKFDNPSNSTYYGNTMAIYTMDPVNNVITIERPQQYWYSNTTYGYGSFATLVFNGIAYLYAIDATYGDNYDIHLAKVPVGHETDMRYYRYYDAAAHGYSSTMPVPTERRQWAAVVSGTNSFTTGSVFWSEYHNAFLLVFFNDMVDSTFRVMSAPSPAGPWNESSAVLYDTVPGPRGYNYDGNASPIYYQQPGQVAGKELLLQYSYQDTKHTYPVALQVTFA